MEDEVETSSSNVEKVSEGYSESWLLPSSRSRVVVIVFFEPVVTLDGLHAVPLVEDTREDCDGCSRLCSKRFVNDMVLPCATDDDRVGC